MSTVLIPCPNCGKALKLRDRSLLGRKGKCPSCDHRFLLQEPEEVPLELADEAAPFGTGAKWIPDEPAAPPSDGVAAAGLAGEPIPVVADDSSARIRDLRRRNARRRNLGILMGGLVALGIGGVVYAVRSYIPEPAEPEAKRSPAVNVAYEAQTKSLRSNSELASTLSPTDGEPIRLLYLPAGASLLIHLRPAELWQDTDQAKEFRYALGEPLVPWIESKIKELCLYEAARIEELLVSIMLGPRGSQPEVAAVVHLADAPRPSELILKIQSAQMTAVPETDESGLTIYKGETRAFLIVDDNTFATAPVRMAADLPEAIRQPALTQPAVEEILLETDRERQLTIVFPPTDTRIHLEALVPEIARPLFDRLCLWLGDDIEAVAWSMHLGPEQFFSEFVLRNQHAREQMVITPTELERQMKQRLEQLPSDLLAAVQKMNPQESGRRRLIGRFAAMTKAYALSTLSGIGERSVQLTTILPERAAPNLALGALLTWDESTRTDFSKAAPAPALAADTLPERIVERLKKPIEIDFRRTPLQEAIDYIGSEASVKFEIDGNALKLGGMTQNMPQTFALGVVPAADALTTLLKNYEKEGLCIVVDEAQQTAIVTTRAAAKQKNQTPHEF